MYIRYATGDEEFYSYVKDPYELRNLVDNRLMQSSVAAARRITKLRCQPLPIGMSW
jgi:hypothetical protein